MKHDRLLLGGLLAMCLVHPLLLLLGACFGFEVIVRSWGIHGVVFTALFVFLSIRALRREEEAQTGSILAALLFPASAVHAFVWTIGKGRSWLAALLSLVWVGFSAALMMKNTKSFGAKIAAYFLSILILLPTFAGVLMLPFALGHHTVMQTITSPERTHRAEAIDSDQGALGGDTIVEVYDLRKQWDAIIFLFQKEPQEIYWGDWGEFKTMKLEWQSEQVLLINGKPYGIQ